MTIPDYDEKTHCSHCGQKKYIQASKFQREQHTIGKADQWTILAIRILNFMDREDVADGLDKEYAALEEKIALLEEQIALPT